MPPPPPPPLHYRSCHREKSQQMSDFQPCPPPRLLTPATVHICSCRWKLPQALPRHPLFFQRPTGTWYTPSVFSLMPPSLRGTRGGGGGAGRNISPGEGVGRIGSKTRYTLAVALYCSAGWCAGIVLTGSQGTGDNVRDLVFHGATAITTGCA